jgi:hypothetical protein
LELPVRLPASGAAVLCAAVGCVDATPESELDARTGWSPPGVAPQVRPDTPGNNLLFSFERGDIVETFGSPGGSFLIHFTRVGTNAVPETDADMSGVPDFVEQVAEVYDEVLAFYTMDLGFRPPRDDGAIADNGGDARFDVYLVDFAGFGDGAYTNDACTGDVCAGYILQENDFSGYGYPSTLVANRVIGSHELFHAIQAAYDVGQGSVLGEGSAVWATEMFDPSLDDFEYLVGAYLENTDQPIDQPLPGPVDPFSYGTGIFFRFLDEAYGPGMVRTLWEACENGAGGVADPVWLQVIDPSLQSVASVSFADAFTEFARWNLFTDVFADPAQAYADGPGYPRVRVDAATAPLQDDELLVYYASARYFGFDPAGRASMTAALVAPATAPDAVTGLRLLVVTESGNARAVTELPDATDGTAAIPTPGETSFIVVVVNTTTEGDPREPGLCVGTVDEVVTCKQALVGGGIGGGGGAGGGGAGGGTSGGGGPGGGTGEGDGGGDGDGIDDGGDEAGCGCALPGSGRDTAGGWFVVAAVAVRYADRRRRRSAATTSSAA